MESTRSDTACALRDLAAFVREAAAAGVLNADELEDNGLLAAADAALAGEPARDGWSSEPPPAPDAPRQCLACGSIHTAQEMQAWWTRRLELIRQHGPQHHAATWKCPAERAVAP